MIPARARIGRRALLWGAAALGFGAGARLAQAMGRVPLGGEIRLRVPFSTRSLDPHDLGDPLAAFFGHAIADPLYARDASGSVYPALADGLPRKDGGECVVRLRPGLRTARGKPLGARDLAWSINRSRAMGAAGWLGALDGPAREDRADPLLVRLGSVEPELLAGLLCSPLTALLPLRYSPTAPDGTGAFMARFAPGELELVRNPNAARGPSFLARVLVRAAPDLADSLRAFEAGHDDVGWLGLGLHGDRAGARRFDYGEVGWVVLATGKGADRFGAPGIAQQLADAVPIERLGHLGLRGRSGVGPSAAWSGAPAAVLVAQGEPQLEAIARAVAAALTQGGHELAVTAVPLGQLRRALDTGDFVLAVYVVRRVAQGPLGALLGLATAERAALGRDIGRHPPKLGAHTPAHELTRTLRLGVLGGLHASGGTAPSVLLAAASPEMGGIDLGSSYVHG